jgi:two-component system response regulator HydG
VSASVLVVDDERGVCELLESGLRKRGFSVRWTTSALEALALVAEHDFDVVVSDLVMPELGGLELCERVAQNRADLPVVVVTAFGSFDTAIAAIRAGAYDFITKPFEMGTLTLTLERAARHRALRDEVKRLRRAVSATRGATDLVGSSAPMVAVHDLVDRVAESDVTVLVTGESGTGKELVARAIHERGRRASGPFVPVNCAAVTETLLESELFGHARGAFTDARSARAGLFAQANGGTLFLDEIGDMPLGLQPKLLRALQERRVRPVGSDQETPIDVRIVAATNRDLEGAIEEGRFRADLYYRIAVVHVDLPPLRSRGRDVLLLAQRFLEATAAATGRAIRGITPQAAQRLLDYQWPGNVRELKNCIERAVALARYEEIVVDDLPEKVQSYRRSHVIVAAEDPSELVTLDEVERRYILRVVDAAGGNRTLAARILGLDRVTLYRKLQRMGVKGDAKDR